MQDWQAEQMLAVLRDLAEIELAKLAEMRAARMLSDPQEHCLKTSDACATADRLTAKALGETEATDGQ